MIDSSSRNTCSGSLTGGLFACIHWQRRCNVPSTKCMQDKSSLETHLGSVTVQWHRVLKVARTPSTPGLTTEPLVSPRALRTTFDLVMPNGTSELTSVVCQMLSYWEKRKGNVRNDTEEQQQKQKCLAFMGPSLGQGVPAQWLFF